LFDIRTDPEEKENLADLKPQLRDAMIADLSLILQTISTQQAPGVAPRLTEDDIEWLRSLGYVK
jgi:hypothetical protein